MTRGGSTLGIPRTTMLLTFTKGATGCVDPMTRRDMFSYLSPEQRVRADNPLRAIRRMTDDVLASLSPRFAKMDPDIGRPSIPPEQLLRALLIQSLYTVRSERLLMEEIDYSVLYRWFVGLGMDDPIRSPTTFSKTRDRCWRATSPARSLMASSAKLAPRGCSRTSTSPSTARSWKRGRVLRVSAARMKVRPRRPTIPAIRR